MSHDEALEGGDRELAIIEALRRILRAVDLHSRKLFQEHGLTAPQLAALREIHRVGPLSAGEVARRIHLSPGTVTGILTRLEERGLVCRARSAADQRRTEIRLTASGIGVLQKSPSLLQDRFRQSLAELEDWEQHLLLAALQRIASMMDARDLDASPHLTIGHVASSPNDAAAGTKDVTGEEKY